MTDAGAPWPPDAPTAAMPQAVLAGRYRLEQLIGQGGSAQVWRATDTLLGRVVAVKLVTVPTTDGAARAGDEARTLARLSHPALVPVFDAGSDAHGRPFVVMELVSGETLAAALQRGPLPPLRCAVVGLTVAEALAYVHAQGLVHRDVKPANVLVGQDGRVRLTDFGVARLVDAARVTSTGLMVGTASYLAPEQVVGQPVGPPADVYALGLVLLESLTGRREYDGTTIEVALARLHRPPTIPASLPGGWPALLGAMTAQDPIGRPTARQAADALGGLAAGDAGRVMPFAPTQVLGGSAQVPGRPAQGDPAPVGPAPADATRVLPTVPAAAVPGPGPVAPVRRGRRGLWLLVAAVLVLALGGLLAARTLGGAAPAPAVVDSRLPAQLQSDLHQLQAAVPT